MAIYFLLYQSPETTVQLNIPPEYQEYSELFSKAKASDLPPHCPYDCAIDFLAGGPPPHNWVYPLSTKETNAMEELNNLGGP